MPIERGALAEAMASTWAIRKGHTVAWPTRGQTPTWDFILEDAAGKLYKVQVKCVYSKRGKPCIDLFRSQHQRYAPEEVDVFIAVDVDYAQIWWIPILATEGKSRIVLTTKKIMEYCVS